ncbi:uncharacterized protein LOC107412951 isoform X2 [Ziziphus jujuba]|uniref:Uncharacterized protein LOC107412951 isoform X2 n=2 Tax=Ziziphus jujuba TaxID=326968 RepID=A0A6P3ZDQ3_ZIZJJ|nr:uncharacterized protein LOC107412951 isoform X2 [Ziziphus jujuba]
MAVTTRSSPSLTLLFHLLLLATPPPSQSLSYSQYRSLFSLAHSLMARVANLRAARGDISGANRARVMAEQLERGLGLGFWGYVWSAGWDYTKNYAWRDLSYTELYGAVSDANELLRWLGELSGARSEAARAAWVSRNYQNVARVSSSLLRKLLKVFRQSGMLRELVETVQREVVDGGLLRDCLELGSNDLKGLIQILRDLGLQYFPNPASPNSNPDL